MLERATACLKSGAARESLRCTQYAPRSKRMLHSTFWNHGAGDLDLPPCALPMVHATRELSLLDGDMERGSKKSKNGVQTDMLREGVFLDFLYPPQALAWLQHHHRQQWQKRNARRLPDGFVVASRGYSSQAQWRDLFAQAPETVDEQGEAEFVEDQNSDLETTRNEETPGDGWVPDEAQDTSVGHDEYSVDEQYRARHSRRDLDDRELLGSSQQSTFGDSPSDLAERLDTLTPEEVGTGIEHNEDDVRRLRNVMIQSRSGGSRNRTELTQSAVELWDSLGKADRADSRLKRELLEWLSLQDNHTAQIRAIEVYRSLSSTERTLQSYQAVLPAMIAQSYGWSILTVHTEALQNLENGHQVTLWLFRHALETQNWGMAMTLEKQHHEKYATTAQASQINVFWLHVSEMPGLLSKAVSLFNYLRTSSSLNDADSNQRRFLARFLKEALEQAFVRKDAASSLPNQVPDVLRSRRHIRRFMYYVTKTESNAVQLFEDMMLATLGPESGFRYEHIHHIVSSMYMGYRALPGARPSEHLLRNWLNRLTEHAETYEEPGSTVHGVSIGFVLKEWKKYHGKISKSGAKRLLTFRAKLGQVKGVERCLEYIRSNYPAYADQKDMLFAMIWVHAKRSDLDAAQAAFATVSRYMAEHGDEPDIKCWNALLLAHSRSDDLEGALTNLQNLMSHGKMQPDNISVQNVLQLLAKRGDVDGMENLLSQYRSLPGSVYDTAHLGSLLTAYVNNDDVETAETVLQQSIPRIHSKDIPGPVIGCFNILLTAHAMRRDMGSTIRTYRWMKEEGVELDGNSYAALIQALVQLRRTQQAYDVMRLTMPKHDITPTAFHYAIIISGFIRNRQSQKAAEVYEDMKRKNIRTSISTNVAYLNAKALLEHYNKRDVIESSGELVPLDETIALLKSYLEKDDGSAIARTKPAAGLSRATFDLGEAASAAYFRFLIYIHGQRKCYQAVRDLYQRYKQDNARSRDTSSISILVSLASAHYEAGEFDKVAECWQSAKEEADRIAPLVPVPHLKMRKIGNNVESNALNLMPPLDGDSQAEEEPKLQASESRVENAETESSELPIGSKQTLLLDKGVKHAPRPAPARSYILSRILRYYIMALDAQKRTMDTINTITQVLTQGYTLDNRTWNTFIRTLCDRSPPLTLLAFVLTERFLAPNFPGWSPIVMFPPKPEAVAVGLQYIKARYLPPGRLLPQYHTLVWLAGALISTRRMQAMGVQGMNDIPPELRKYIGNYDRIRKQAPKTLAIVQSMPRVPDKIQSELLGKRNL